ncbi:MAG: hypothetical protein AB2697_17715 [Candidatus Thiodiazotropha endolucinida]
MATNSHLNGAVLALHNLHQRLYKIEAAAILLNRLGTGEIQELDTDPPLTFGSLASESLTKAMDGIFSDCWDIQTYIESAGNKSLSELKADISSASRQYGVDVSYEEPGRAQS